MTQSGGNRYLAAVFRASPGGCLGVDEGADSVEMQRVPRCMVWE